MSEESENYNHAASDSDRSERPISLISLGREFRIVSPDIVSWSEGPVGHKHSANPHLAFVSHVQSLVARLSDEEWEEVKKYRETDI